MVNSENEGGSTGHKHGEFISTSYSNRIVCGACGAPLKHVPVMYEHMEIDWRCGRCLRRDKPTADDQIG